mmetsp:Transcript_69579/g.165964  ORF Transcript_69579/g.165964 Transcript_69579/m.165964 type:complete len:231 (-) Transcript_69579:637-1329(-)
MPGSCSEGLLHNRVLPLQVSLATHTSEYLPANGVCAASSRKWATLRLGQSFAVEKRRRGCRSWALTSNAANHPSTQHRGATRVIRHHIPKRRLAQSPLAEHGRWPRRLGFPLRWSTCSSRHAAAAGTGCHHPDPSPAKQPGTRRLPRGSEPVRAHFDHLDLPQTVRQLHVDCSSKARRRCREDIVGSEEACGHARCRGKRSLFWGPSSSIRLLLQSPAWRHSHTLGRGRN